MIFDDDLEPLALEYMRNKISETEYFQELDMVDRISTLNLIMDGIALYLEGISINVAADIGGKNVH